MSSPSIADTGTSRRHYGTWLALAWTALIALSGCATPAVGGATPTPSVRPTALATPILPPTPLGSALGPPPTDCQTLPPPQTFTMTSGFGGGFVDPVFFQGGPPAWTLGFASPLHAGDFGGPDNPYPAFKVMWVVGPDFTGIVTLEGHDLRTNAPLWFQIYPSNYSPDNPSVYTTRAALDPQSPNRGTTTNSKGHWSIWGIGLIPLAAGCYELDVSSSGGTWHTVFAAGK